MGFAAPPTPKFLQEPKALCRLEGSPSSPASERLCGGPGGFRPELLQQRGHGRPGAAADNHELLTTHESTRGGRKEGKEAWKQSCTGVSVRRYLSRSSQSFGVDVNLDPQGFPSDQLTPPRHRKASP